jgi:hypothetical protein
MRQTTLSYPLFLSYLLALPSKFNHLSSVVDITVPSQKLCTCHYLTLSSLGLLSSLTYCQPSVGCQVHYVKLLIININNWLDGVLEG